MKLDGDKGKELMAFLEKNWPDPKICPVCGHDDWKITERVYEIREFHEQGVLDTSGAIIPFIVASCSNCGNTRFFNAIVVGVVKSQKKEAKNE